MVISVLMFMYYQICAFTPGANVEWISEQQVPYATYGSAWLGYDDKRSFSSKVTHYYPLRPAVLTSSGK